jgi:hypothetical protein
MSWIDDLANWLFPKPAKPSKPTIAKEVMVENKKESEKEGKSEDKEEA